MVDPATIKAGAFVWKLAKPITRIKRALNKRRARKGKPLLEINQEHDVKTIIGAMRSKTIWFGVLTEIWGLIQTFAVDGGQFTPENIVTLVSGVVIIVLRAVTNKSLADK